jgi:hypothetical protein
MIALSKNPKEILPTIEINEVVHQNETIKEDLTQKAKELIQDKIDALNWYQMQELVA